jgi:hypothetical protein
LGIGNGVEKLVCSHTPGHYRRYYLTGCGEERGSAGETWSQSDQLQV